MTVQTDDPYRTMRHIRVVLDDGSGFETNINGTKDQIRRYYRGTPIVTEDQVTGKETTRWPVTVVFFD